MGKRGRPSIRRMLALLVALLLLLLLWELNRWLPGAWPGGGGGGSLSAELPETGETDRNAPKRTEPDQTDASRVESGEEMPDWQRRGVTVEVRAFDGAVQTDWHMGIGDSGPEDQKPAKDGTVRATDKQIFDQGFRVRATTAMVRHHFGTQRPASKWAVYLPSRTVARQRTHPGSVDVRVVTLDGERPVEGVEVSAYHPRSLEPARVARTDTKGFAQIKGLQGIVKVAVLGNDASRRYWVGDAWADPREREPVLLRVVRANSIQVQWSHSGRGAVARAHRARVRAADGRTIMDVRPPLDSSAQFRLKHPRKPLRGARLEVAFSNPAAPDGGASTAEWARPIPSDGPVVFGSLIFRYVNVSVQGTKGPVAGAKITAYYTPADAEPEARPLRAQATTRADGTTVLALPEAASARALVEAPGLAAKMLALPASVQDASVTLSAGVQHRVRVMPPQPKATVLLRMSVEGLRLERAATTNDQGLATFEGLPSGDAELHAQVDGSSWSTATTRTGGETELILNPGGTLALAVATLQGFPVGGARAEFIGQGKEKTVATDPRRRVYESDADDGMLTIPALPVQPYRVLLTAPGYRSLEVRGLVPGKTTYFVSLVPKNGR